MQTHIPTSSFTADLVSLNILADFAGYHFEEGMCYGEKSAWWPGTDERTHPHEGLDICFFKSRSGETKTLGIGTSIPPLFPGRVVNVFGDFIAWTIVMCHSICNEKDQQLHSMYGHVDPEGHVTPGMEITTAEKIATIADSAIKKRPMISHLHLSTLWLPVSFPAESVSWGMEVGNDAGFCDPMRFLSDRY